jgi:4-diphosphocytidyl-2-C-methyl-D-erythritol kinase
MSDPIVISAPAKINLCLKILGKRNDGYHDILSLVQFVNLYDRLELSSSNSGIELEVKGIEVPSDASNLVWRAAALLKRRHKIDAGVRVRLDKRIPTGSGLGGGSSDAAAALIGLNRLWEIDLSTEQLRELGEQLGSDVPVFFSGGQALVSGRGEIVEEVSLPTDYGIALLVPNISVSTEWAYRQLRFPLTSEKPKANLDLAALRQGFYKYLSDIGNDFEDLTLRKYPVIRTILAALRKAGANYAAMTGSGSAAFGLFAGKPEMELQTKLPELEGVKAFWLQPVCR